MKKIIKLFICVCILLSLSACQKQQTLNDVQESNDNEEIKVEDNVINEDNKPVENSENYKPIDIVEQTNFYIPSELNTYNNKPDLWSNKTISQAYDRYRQFAYESFNSTISKGENEIFSPLSLYYALALLVNAADGDTKKELETVMHMSVDDLNQFLYELDENSYDQWGVDYLKANAIWYNSDLGSLKEDYKNTIKKYYGDSINEQSFKNVSQLVNDVNNWSKKNTQDSIDKILEESDISNDTVFLLLNALAAGGEWSIPFDKTKTVYENFNNYDKTNSMVEMMHQTLSGYWSDDNSEGFIKETMTGLYFIGILPNEGIDVYDYLNNAGPEAFYNYSKNVKYDDVVGYFKPTYSDFGECPILDLYFTNLSFPKFKYEQKYDLVDTFKKIGLINLFDSSTCNLSKMDDGELYVEFAKQNATIEVDEENVFAAAVTAIGGGKGGGDCLEIRNKIYHDVIFNRPFIFAIYTNGKELPLFMGIVNQLGDKVENGFRIQNITGKINIRNIPSTKGEKLGFFEKDQIVYAFEKKEAEGYTWYRIGDNKWVADQKGEWIKEID